MSTPSLSGSVGCANATEHLESASLKAPELSLIAEIRNAALLPPVSVPVPVPVPVHEAATWHVPVCLNLSPTLSERSTAASTASRLSLDAVDEPLIVLPPPPVGVPIAPSNESSASGTVDLPFTARVADFVQSLPPQERRVCGRQSAQLAQTPGIEALSKEVNGLQVTQQHSVGPLSELSTAPCKVPISSQPPLLPSLQQQLASDAMHLIGVSASINSTLPQAPAHKAQVLIPPENFGMVCSGVYRSSFPQACNLPFLLRLKLRAVVCLSSEPYPTELMRGFAEHGIRLIQLPLPAAKDSFDRVCSEVVCAVLRLLCNSRLHPLLIHCNKGKHRTGYVVGCLRRLQGWSLTAVFEEYRRFSQPKCRQMDMQFMELFDAQTFIDQLPRGQDWTPDWVMPASAQSARAETADLPAHAQPGPNV